METVLTRKTEQEVFGKTPSLALSKTHTVAAVLDIDDPEGIGQVQVSLAVAGEPSPAQVARFVGLCEALERALRSGRWLGL